MESWKVDYSSFWKLKSWKFKPFPVRLLERHWSIMKLEWADWLDKWRLREYIPSSFSLFHQCCRYVEVRKKVTSCFGSIGSFINDNERNGICLKVGLTTTSEWGSSSASSASLLTARLAPSVTKSICTGCCCKLGLILFPFLLAARLCCLWPDLDHIHVGYRSHTKDILSPQGPPPS